MKILTCEPFTFPGSVLLLLALSLGTPAAHGALHYQQLKSFGFPNQGQHPSAPLIQGSDGGLYGTTTEGGSADNAGVVFRMNKDGSGYSVLHNFATNGVDGIGPVAGLLNGSDGVLYGTTSRGGSSDAGTVFKLTTDGSGYSVLHSFSTNAVDGANPWWAGVIEGSNGLLYGTTSGGGADGGGTVFMLKQDGSAYAVLHSFSTTDGDGYAPAFGLVQGSDGALYGTTERGGTNSAGTVFKIGTDGTGYTALHGFSASDGTPGMAFSRGPLIEASDRALYGTTYSGGTNRDGTVFKLNKDGSAFLLLHTFGIADVDGANPAGGLLEASDGSLYGATYRGGGTNEAGAVFKLNKDGSGYKLIHSFSSDSTDGQSPWGGLLEASDGALYGTSVGGGADFQGTVFRLDKDGSGYRTLRSFWSGEGTSGDGGLPRGLVLSRDGTIYGTTESGGATGVGTVFKLKSDGSGYKVILNFGSTPGDGGAPQARLIEASDGALYGTTHSGGTSGAGTVFKLNRDGSGYTILHSFSNGGGDGSFPAAALVETSDGALYGTTDLGGAYYTNQNPTGGGIVFRLNKDGSNYSVVYSFGHTYGTPKWPSALIEGSDAALYGTSGSGGTTQYYGTAFKLQKDGSGFRLLHNFGVNSGDGTNPAGGLIEGSDGALYGTAHTGFNNEGVVFRMNKDGSGYSVLRRFSTTGAEGQDPIGGLVEGIDGALYGTTAYGGASTGGRGYVPGTGAYTYGSGTVFSLNKDGSGYRVLYSYRNDGSDGAIPMAALVHGRDGAYYGTTYYGGLTNLWGGLGAGTIFRIWPPETPDMVGVTMSANSKLVSFSGASGYHYQLLLSTNLISWIVLTNITMPPSGIYTNVETAPPSPAAYYRAAWVP